VLAEKKNNLTWLKCKVQLNKKHLYDTLFAGWLTRVQSGWAGF